MWDGVWYSVAETGWQVACTERRHGGDNTLHGLGKSAGGRLAAQTVAHAGVRVAARQAVSRASVQQGSQD